MGTRQVEPSKFRRGKNQELVPTSGGRYLNAAEISALARTFRNVTDLDWTSVKVAKSWMSSTGITFGGTIHVPADMMAINDFVSPMLAERLLGIGYAGVTANNMQSQAIALRGFFFHEGTHIVQEHRWGLAGYLGRALTERQYGFSLSPATNYGQLGMEQQASVVQGAYLAGHGISLRQALNNPPLEVYREVLKRAGIFF